MQASGALTSVERRTTLSLSAVFAMRMLGLFVVLPVFAVYGRDLQGATPLLIGMAIGAYGLVQGVLQIPFGILSDRIGRKPMIYAGLAMFALGGVVAAMSTSIWGVIAGRALQGTGAISGVVMALLSDLVRDSHRTRSMAIIGATVGLSFGVAMVLGPVIASGWGLSGLFYFTSAMAVASLLMIMLWVPTPVAMAVPATQEVLPQLWRVLKHPGLFRLDLGIFLLHMVMVAVFLVVPVTLESDDHLPASEHWRIYLPVILVSLVIMAPLMMRAERSGRVPQALVLAGSGMVVAMLMLAVLHRNLWGMVSALLVFFTAFNLLEALMPSLVSRMSPTGSRGAAMGVYSSGQFAGAFFGGVVGGGLAEVTSESVVLVVCAVLFGAWTIYVAGVKFNTKRQNFVVDLPSGDEDPQQFVVRLLGVPGVVEATAVREEHVVYVTVEVARFDAEKLRIVTGRSSWEQS